MKNLSIGKSLLAVTVSLAISTAAYSDTYFGGSFGQSSLDYPGYEDANSFKAFGGMRFNNIGFEAAYINLGEFDISGPGGTGSIDVNGIELSAVGYLPISDSIDLMAKAGLFAWNLDATLNNVPYGSDNGADLTFGLGAQYKVTDDVAVRVEYQMFNDAGDDDYDMLSAGVSYNF